MNSEDLPAFCAHCVPALMAAGYDRKRAVTLAFDLAVDVAAEVQLRGGDRAFEELVSSEVEQRRPEKRRPFDADSPRGT